MALTCEEARLQAANKLEGPGPLWRGELDGVSLKVSRMTDRDPLDALQSYKDDKWRTILMLHISVFASFPNPPCDAYDLFVDIVENFAEKRINDADLYKVRDERLARQGLSERKKRKAMYCTEFSSRLILPTGVQDYMSSLWRGQFCKC